MQAIMLFQIFANNFSLISSAAFISSMLFSAFINTAQVLGLVPREL